MSATPTFFWSCCRARGTATVLPDALRYWKIRVEESDPDKTFRVGLIYGPSGCGKSSLIKAGLLPRLGTHGLPPSTSKRRPRKRRPACCAASGGSFPTCPPSPARQLHWPSYGAARSSSPVRNYWSSWTSSSSGSSPAAPIRRAR